MWYFPRDCGSHVSFATISEVGVGRIRVVLTALVIATPSCMPYVGTEGEECNEHDLCVDDLVCVDGKCEKCADECSPETDVRRCVVVGSRAQTQNCRQSGRCARWSLLFYCGDDEVCQNNRCVQSCPGSVCREAETRCNRDRLETCLTGYGQNGCPGWYSSSCGNWKCAGGACVDPN